MFVDFLFALRARHVSVSLHEWMTLQQGLVAGLHDSTLDGFYHLARAVLVKRLADYDRFDEAFMQVFRGVHAEALRLTDELAAWLRDEANARALSADELAALQRLSIDELRRKFAERLAEQRERHDGGSRWIGTGGSSPFGTGGTHPTGLRLGDGGGRTAMQVATERRFREYRTDIVLDVRQIDVALRGLRELGRVGAADELDLDATIAATGRNAGDIDIVLAPPRRNRAKVILLMDVGGSMDPHSALMSRLFTAAARAGRFARFRAFYFHNCIYGAVYADASFQRPVALADLFADSDRTEKLVVVADGAMHPAELLSPGYQSRQAGLDWLRLLREQFVASAWLSPEPEQYWPGTTVEVIGSLFAMWPLTLDGLTAAVRHLTRAG